MTSIPDPAGKTFEGTSWPHHSDAEAECDALFAAAPSSTDPRFGPACNSAERTDPTMRDYDKPVTNPEPPDCTKVAVYEGNGEWKVIARNDARAAEFTRSGAHAEDRWFEDDLDVDDCIEDRVSGEDGMGWQQHLKYAEGFYVIDPTSYQAVTR